MLMGLQWDIYIHLYTVLVDCSTGRLYFAWRRDVLTARVPHVDMHVQLYKDREVDIVMVRVLPKWSQYCRPTVTAHTVIRDKELWPHLWLAWLKLHVRA